METTPKVADKGISFTMEIPQFGKIYDVQMYEMGKHHFVNATGEDLLFEGEVIITCNAALSEVFCGEGRVSNYGHSETVGSMEFTSHKRYIWEEPLVTIHHCQKEILELRKSGIIRYAYAHIIVTDDMLRLAGPLHYNDLILVSPVRVNPRILFEDGKVRHYEFLWNK